MTVTEHHLWLQLVSPYVRVKDNPALEACTVFPERDHLINDGTARYNFALLEVT